MTQGWGMTLVSVLTPIVVALVIGLIRHVRTDIVRETVITAHEREIATLRDRVDRFLITPCQDRQKENP